VVPQLNEFMLKLDPNTGNQESQTEAAQQTVDSLSSEINKMLLLTSKVFEIMVELKDKKNRLQDRVNQQHQDLRAYNDDILRTREALDEQNFKTSIMLQDQA
jgi:rRNA pseudouridine-1189 N-methylase Emg1 (Nep1/Mra1 family)